MTNDRPSPAVGENTAAEVQEMLSDLSELIAALDRLRFGQKRSFVHK